MRGHNPDTMVTPTGMATAVTRTAANMTRTMGTTTVITILDMSTLLMGFMATGVATGMIGVIAAGGTKAMKGIVNFTAAAMKVMGIMEEVEVR